jgi:hypothetical protein
MRILSITAPLSLLLVKAVKRIIDINMPPKLGSLADSPTRALELHLRNQHLWAGFLQDSVRHAG